MARLSPAALVLLMMFAAAAAGQPAPAQLAPRIGEKLAASGRIDGALRQMIADARGQTPGAQKLGDSAAGARRVPVTVRFRTEDASVNRRALAAFGVAPANEAPGIAEAYIPLAAVEALSIRPDVVSVEAILPPKPLIVGQGASVHQTSSWNAAGRAGAGVKVGIVDIGFIGLSSRVGSELPGAIVGRCYTSLGVFSSSLSSCETTTAHGTGVAEAVADLAPGVELYVANPKSHLDLYNTVTWMVSQGVRVINHSVGWTWSGPGDGTTPFTNTPLASVDAAVAGGALWANAAGNEALSTWSGAGLFLPDGQGNRLLAFSDATITNAVFLTEGQQFVGQARWEDSWTAAARDVDIYLVDGAGNFVAGSEAVQDGTPGRVPREAFGFAPAASGWYYLVVNHYSGSTPQWVDVQAFSGEDLQFATGSHSISNPAETGNPGALAVGAAPWYNTAVIEPFSSRGPTRDGRTKPDIVAADQADSVTYGVNGFAGTSQASPHVAGLAALIFESFPTASPRLVAQYLRTVAAPRGAPNTFGAGFAQVPVFPATVGLSALLSSATLPSAAGQPITWTAFGIGAQAPFEYKFWLNSSGAWTVLRDYSSSNSVTWTPPAAGQYAIQAWVRRVGSSATYDDWRGTDFFRIDPPAPVTVAPLAANVGLPASYGTPITWTATATGGVAPLEYKFWRFSQTAGWSMVRDYSTSNTFTWTPSATDAGRYALQVWVRSAGSAAAYEGWAATTFFDILGPPPVQVLSLFANATFPVQTGTNITWAATATGGLAQLEYKFWRFKLGVGWTAVQEYSTTGLYSWTPGPADAGTYAIQVWVRQVGSTVNYEAWRGTDLFVVTTPPPARLTSFLQSPSGGGITGAPITWSATASGGTAPLLYKFWLNSGGAWTVLQDWSSSSTVTWTPQSAGSYAAQVWVRSSTSSATYDDWRSTGIFTVTGSPTAFVNDLSANVGLPAMVTQPMTWTASAGGGTAPLQYKFWRYKEGAGWTMVQDYSASATYTWTPATGEQGTYALQVWVRSAGSTATYEGWRGTGFFQVVPSTVLLMASMPGDYIGGGVTNVYTPADVPFSAARNFDNGVTLSLYPPTSGLWWFLDFAAPGDVELTTTLYPYATRFPFQEPANAGLDVSGSGRGCNQSVGRFVVREVTYLADGTPEKFAADYEQHCEGSAAGLYGAIRYNSTIPLVGIRPVTVVGADTVSVGSPATWTVMTLPGREYKTWLYRQSTRTWAVLHEYTTNPTRNWTPQAGDQGGWAVVIWERPTGSTALYQNWYTSGAITVQ